jgi:hypothetical protein
MNLRSSTPTPTSTNMFKRDEMFSTAPTVLSIGPNTFKELEEATVDIPAGQMVVISQLALIGLCALDDDPSIADREMLKIQSERVREAIMRSEVNVRDLTEMTSEYVGKDVNAKLERSTYIVQEEKL